MAYWEFIYYLPRILLFIAEYFSNIPIADPTHPPVSHKVLCTKHVQYFTQPSTSSAEQATCINALYVRSYCGTRHGPGTDPSIGSIHAYGNENGTSSESVLYIILFGFKSLWTQPSVDYIKFKFSQTTKSPTATQMYSDNVLLYHPFSAITASHTEQCFQVYEANFLPGALSELALLLYKR